MDFFEVVHTQRSIRKFKDEPVPERMLGVLEKCEESYRRLYAHRLTA